MKWVWIILALLYFLSPYDLIPGIHGVGWIDDIVVLILLFRYLSRLNRADTAERPSSGTNEHQQQNCSSGANHSDEIKKEARSPYEILNVPPNADPAEIRVAYRKLANQYHPDKVTHLGKEFQQLAEQRFKEIQEAYRKLVR